MRNQSFTGMCFSVWITGKRVTSTGAHVNGSTGLERDEGAAVALHLTSPFPGDASCSFQLVKVFAEGPGIPENSPLGFSEPQLSLQGWKTCFTGLMKWEIHSGVAIK